MQKSDCSWRLSLSRRQIRIGRTNKRRGKSVFILRTILSDKAELRRGSFGRRPNRNSFRQKQHTRNGRME